MRDFRVAISALLKEANTIFKRKVSDKVTDQWLAITHQIKDDLRVTLNKMEVYMQLGKQCPEDVKIHYENIKGALKRLDSTVETVENTMIAGSSISKKDFAQFNQELFGIAGDIVRANTAMDDNTIDANLLNDKARVNQNISDRLTEYTGSEESQSLSAPKKVEDAYDKAIKRLEGLQSSVKNPEQQRRINLVLMGLKRRSVDEVKGIEATKRKKTRQAHYQVHKTLREANDVIKDTMVVGLREGRALAELTVDPMLVSQAPKLEEISRVLDQAEKNIEQSQAAAFFSREKKEDVSETLAKATTGLLTEYEIAMAKLEVYRQSDGKFPGELSRVHQTLQEDYEKAKEAYAVLEVVKGSKAELTRAYKANKQFDVDDFIVNKGQEVKFGLTPDGHSYKQVKKSSERILMKQLKYLSASLNEVDQKTKTMQPPETEHAAAAVKNANKIEFLLRLDASKDLQGEAPLKQANQSLQLRLSAFMDVGDKDDQKRIKAQYDALKKFDGVNFDLLNKNRNSSPEARRDYHEIRQAQANAASLTVEMLKKHFGGDPDNNRRYQQTWAEANKIAGASDRSLKKSTPTSEKLFKQAEKIMVEYEVIQLKSIASTQLPEIGKKFLEYQRTLLEQYHNFEKAYKELQAVKQNKGSGDQGYKDSLYEARKKLQSEYENLQFQMTRMGQAIDSLPAESKSYLEMPKAIPKEENAGIIEVANVNPYELWQKAQALKTTLSSEACKDLRAEGNSADVTQSLILRANALLQNLPPNSPDQAKLIKHAVNLQKMVKERHPTQAQQFEMANEIAAARKDIIRSLRDNFNGDPNNLTVKTKWHEADRLHDPSLPLSQEQTVRRASELKSVSHASGNNVLEGQLKRLHSELKGLDDANKPRDQVITEANKLLEHVREFEKRNKDHLSQEQKSDLETVKSNADSSLQTARFDKQIEFLQNWKTVLEGEKENGANVKDQVSQLKEKIDETLGVMAEWKGISKPDDEHATQLSDRKAALQELRSTVEETFPEVAPQRRM